MSLPFKLEVSKEEIANLGCTYAQYRLWPIKNDDISYIPELITINLSARLYTFKAYERIRNNKQFYSMFRDMLILDKKFNYTDKDSDGYQVKYILFLEPKENVHITKSPWKYNLGIKAVTIPNNKKILQENAELFMKCYADEAEDYSIDTLKYLFPSSYKLYKVFTNVNQDMETGFMYENIYIDYHNYIDRFKEENYRALDLYYEDDANGKRIREISKQEYEDHINIIRQQRIDLQKRRKQECEELRDHLYNACLDNSIYEELKDIDLKECLSSEYFNTYLKQILSIYKSESNLHHIIYDKCPHIDNVKLLRKDLLSMLKIYFECLNLNETNIPIIFSGINVKEIKNFPFLTEIMQNPDHPLHAYIKSIPKNERHGRVWEVVEELLKRKYDNNQIRNEEENEKKDKYDFTKYFKITQENVGRPNYRLILDELNELLNKNKFSKRSITIKEFDLDVDIFRVDYETFGLDDFDRKYNPNKDPNDPDNFHNFSRLKTISETYNKEYPDKKISCQEVKH